ncbi:copper chaperone PCu(A)C [Nocardiopsis ansamitocini]|uniref:copper chaperone PCu(A)C n=1 Tax=Nocardiopsis ansamitocini TaxID=1670832 RepID=UPI00255708F0|nr:copper chaperone PCu(A)C [Nocardiopsis ansamitocini]
MAWAALPLAVLATGCGGGTASDALGDASDTRHTGPDKGAARSGDLRVEEAWIPEPAMPEMSVAYLTIANDSTEDDALVDASTSASPDTDLCSTVTTDSGASQMRVVEEIPVPAGGSTQLKSGGFHLMVNDIPDPVGVGDTVTLTLSFVSGTEVEVEAPVLERTAGNTEERDAGGDHSGHH